MVAIAALFYGYKHDWQDPLLDELKRLERDTEHKFLGAVWAEGDMGKLQGAAEAFAPNADLIVAADSLAGRAAKEAVEAADRGSKVILLVAHTGNPVLAGLVDRAVDPTVTNVTVAQHLIVADSVTLLEDLFHENGRALPSAIAILWNRENPAVVARAHTLVESARRRGRVYSIPVTGNDAPDFAVVENALKSAFGDKVEPFDDLTKRYVSANIPRPASAEHAPTPPNLLSPPSPPGAFIAIEDALLVGPKCRVRILELVGKFKLAALFGSEAFMNDDKDNWALMAFGTKREEDFKGAAATVTGLVENFVTLLGTPLPGVAYVHHEELHFGVGAAERFFGQPPKLPGPGELFGTLKVAGHWRGGKELP